MAATAADCLVAVCGGSMENMQLVFLLGSRGDGIGDRYTLIFCPTDFFASHLCAFSVF